MAESILYIGSFIFIFLLGISFGSFLNSWVWRTHENIRILLDRSFCPHCRVQLKWYENIPVFSFLFLKAKCRTCKGEIPIYYFWVELSTGLIFIFVYYLHFSYFNFEPLYFFRDIVFVSFLIVIFNYDYLYKIILPSVVWTGVLIGFIFNYFYFGYSLENLGLAAFVGCGFFLAQFIVSRGRWIGGGDVRFGFLMGVWLGWPGIVVGLFVSYILGALVSVPLLIFKKKKWAEEIPFGTFLTTGTFMALYWGDWLVDWYLTLLR